jgi:hypothetical protein
MKKSNNLIISRRRFISSASGLVSGGIALSLASGNLYGLQEKPKYCEELTPEETKIVEQSVLAQDLKNYFMKGYT